jgi:hypothetical protein
VRAAEADGGPGAEQVTAADETDSRREQ